MRSSVVRAVIATALAAAASAPAVAQDPNIAAALHWRNIGPVRAGRTRAAVGVPQQPGTFYAGFDNGGVWRTTDYGSNWSPIFDSEGTGSIGAIAVAPSNPSIIYVGTGAGIIRPDLATGDGMYKSTDGGKTWTHLGLRETQMIAWIDVDPKDPSRLFVAALGHPYGPNAERGIFRSTDGGQSFQKVLYTDEYTSGNDVRIDPQNPNVVYAAMWQQQQTFYEASDFPTTVGITTGGVYKSIDGGTTWRRLTDGLPATVIQANLAIAPSNTRVLYATVAGQAGAPGAGGGGGRGGAGGGINMYKSTDAGEHWALARSDEAASRGLPPDSRPLGRIGGGDLPTVTVDPKNPQVVYTASTVMWRSDDGGSTWTAVRGAPGGDDYQRIWINPDNTDILFVVADQGAVVSANRGLSWSNWYTQSTAAMYHVTADNDFPYRLCGGQQDSGSACVASRSDDGIITFNDWHPVNIQEYGIAAPDPRNPDMVYGSARNGVSLWDRKTRQTRQVGPDMSERGPNGEVYNRNVRTMPLVWSPVNPDVLYYASNAVWKTTDRAQSWKRVSPDLTRQTWEVPANAGKYASSVTPGPRGTITALGPSPRSEAVLWAGTDDGNVQVTTDGGLTWKNVTPPAIKPWTRIFNVDAGHFDTQTAYVAANTMRLDDMNPHFWRTHDGGKTWTEINNGIAPGAVANSIREDPRTPGLLFGATDTQVWVSFDDGANWSSLRIDMPAISVRDLKVKDDSTCHCSDLVAGTHGRGFYILDDITPLRQMAALRKAAAANEAYLFKPAPGLRIRFGGNDPTPWPPEMPAGESAPPGALIDYYLPSNTSGATKLEILDAAGKLVRTYSSTDPVLNPDPHRDPAAYNQVCQRNPNAPRCQFPLYWAPPSSALSSQPGVHRWSWELRYDPIAPGAGMSTTGAVPGRTYDIVNTPWVPPGSYTVRLTANGKSYTQPITVRLDPRVKLSPVTLAQLNSLTKEMRDGAVATRAAYAKARALRGALASAGGADAEALKAKVDSIAPAPAAGGGGRGGFGGFGGRGGAPQGPPNLESAANQMISAAVAIGAAEAAPTAGNLAAIGRAREASRVAMARWTQLSTTGLMQLNAKRKAAGLGAVKAP
ncbi:MAG: hypothetical protein IT356_00580 [Gemmatimonadaceae bacterium]|nr:hypothetical protein [Gemmatimonadaceae bacterium]